MTLATPKHEQSRHVRCPPNGTVYFSKGYNPWKQYEYRLIVYEKQDYSHDATTDADWTVETVDRRSGKVLSDLLLEWSCPVGRGNCQIGPRFLSGTSNFQSLDEIPLNFDFTFGREPGSYAIVIPGFVDWQWGYVYSFEDDGDLKFFTRDKVVPDLSSQLIWVRASCTNGSAAR